MAKSKAKSASTIIINSGAEMVAASAIRPHPRNPRHSDVGGLVQLIRANGFYGRCVVQRSSGHILVGNHRYLAAREAGLTQIPVEWVDVDDEQALRILVADNRSSDLANYNDVLLAELLQEQRVRGGLDGTGFDDAALDRLMESLAAEMEKQAAPAESQDAASGEPEEDGAEQGEPARPNSGLGTPVVSYNIIFDDEEQQRKWFAFLRALKALYPDVETTGARLVGYLEAHAPETPAPTA